MTGGPRVVVDVSVAGGDWDAAALRRLAARAAAAALTGAGIAPRGTAPDGPGQAPHDAPGGAMAAGQGAAGPAVPMPDPDAPFELAILACDAARMTALNAQFRGRARPTNVLSWPAWGALPAAPGAPPVVPGGFLGDLALCYETCRDEAAAAGLALEHHLTHLIVHGVLHLLGYDHQNDTDAVVMEKLETRILAGLGIADPYCSA